MSRGPYSNLRDSVQDLRARFEDRDSIPTPALPKPPILRGLRQRSEADMSTPLKDTLNAGPIVGTVATQIGLTSASPDLAGPLASIHPFWIGIQPPVPSQYPDSAMEYPINIEFESSGLQPPVFICTNLSEPAWEPIEMDHDPMEKGNHFFYSVFFAKEGDYQYKLRLGSGNWWVCDESKPIVDDGAGNRNNVATVKASYRSSKAEYTDQDPDSMTYGRRISSIHVVPLFEQEVLARPKTRPMNESKEADELAPLLPHERMSSSQDNPGRTSSASSASRYSGRRRTVVESDLDDPGLQPTLENKDAILDLAQKVSLDTPGPHFDRPHPSVITKVLNRAYDVMQLRDNRPNSRRASTTEDILAAVGVERIPDDDGADHGLSMITEGDEGKISHQPPSDRQPSAKQAALFGPGSDPFAAPLVSDGEASEAEETDPSQLTRLIRVTKESTGDGSGNTAEKEEAEQATVPDEKVPSAL